MSTNCEHCGYRDNEVKSGAAISEKGKKIILNVEDEDTRSISGISRPQVSDCASSGTHQPCGDDEKINSDVP
jgi:C4-type Zn-finger protein